MRTSQRTAIIRNDFDCFVAARELGFTQRTLNINLWQYEFSVNRPGELNRMHTSCSKSSVDFTQLAHNTNLLRLGHHPSLML